MKVRTFLGREQLSDRDPQGLPLTWSARWRDSLAGPKVETQECS